MVSGVSKVFYTQVHSTWDINLDGVHFNKINK